MEKKFKNQSWYVSADSKYMIVAFIEELKRRNYFPQKPLPDVNTSWSIIGISAFTEKQDSNNEILKGWQLYGTAYNPKFHLPEDWNKALDYITETEEVIPEYVKWVDRVGFGNSSYMCSQTEFEKGKVFDTKKDRVPFDLLPTWEEALTEYYYKQNFVPSSLEEYTKQQNAPKFKEGDFVSHIDDEYGTLSYLEKHRPDRGKDYFDVVQLIGEAQGLICLNGTVNTGMNWKYVPDEEVLNQLKKAAVKQGIVEGARVTWGKQVVYSTITGFDLIKNRPCNSRKDAGNSQLAIIINECSGIDTITPTIENFKVLPKEVKVAGYKAELFSAGSFKTLKIGCQQYTKDSLITIRDLIIHGHNGAHTFTHFRLSGVGSVKVTVDELNEAIKLFDQ